MKVVVYAALSLILAAGVIAQTPCDWTAQTGSVVATCGNVGIGTAAPGSLFHVAGSSGQWATFQRGSKRMYVNANWSDSNSFSQIANRATDNMGLSLSSKDSAPEFLFVTTAGRVGIGTTSPEETLDVVGSLGIRAATATDYPAMFHLSASGAAGVNRWSLFVGSASGSMGVPVNDFWLYEYPSGGLPVPAPARLAIRKANTPFGTAPKLFVIDGAGHVGIGILGPTEALDVAGTILARGDIRADGIIHAKYQDLAEWVPAREDLENGTVVVLDPSLGNGVMASTTAYDTAVAGVVSVQPGIILGEEGSSKEKIATTGRVRVRVDAAGAPIRVGDLLVTSDKQGMAMRSVPIEIGGRELHQPGTLIGKALEPLDSGQGEILVLLSLQ